jgi:protein PhnA
MSLESYPALKRFFSTVLMDADADQDLQTTQKFCSESGEGDVSKTLTDLRALLNQSELPIDDFGAQANRWFGDQTEARSWLESLVSVFDSATAAGDSIQVLDSNGALLIEGDSVTVIKDLKVRGGSSDLKRGTLIKKIHLTADPELIECKVDGSVLVLRTEFLKKS